MKLLFIAVTAFIALAFTACHSSPPPPDPSKIGIYSTEAPLAPNVRLSNQHGKLVNLREATSSGYAVVFFYPEADTPGWIKQVKSLRSAYATLTEKGIRVIGISMDTPEKNLRFSQKYHLPFDLLSDLDGEVCNTFEVPHPNNRPRRHTFIFERGRLVHRSDNVYPATQARDTLFVVAIIERRNAEKTRL